MLGPVFVREAALAPRRPRLYLGRSLYVLALFLLVCTGYLLLSGTRPLRSSADLAHFGGWMFALLAPLQLAVLAFQGALGAASSIAQEKDRRTLLLLLLTRLTGTELVAGKLAASLLDPLAMLAAATPVLMALTLFGGVAPMQVLAVTAVTAVTLLAAAATGTVVGLWREKTFQTVAITVMAIVLWLGAGEVIAAGLLPGTGGAMAVVVSPARAVFAAAAPLADEGGGGAVAGFLVLGTALAMVITGVGVARVRAWNPSREARPVRVEQGQGEADERAASWKVREARPVWDNPVLWREVRTWAYGRKVVLVRIGYLLVFALSAVALYASLESGAALERAGGEAGRRLVPAATMPLAPLVVLSLVIVNALAVNSVAGERDALALDLLLVTDLEPREFVFGKLLGVLWVAKEAILLPAALLGYLWWGGGLTGEHLLYTLLGLAVLEVFAATLGLHCGLNYANSRSATLTSLGTVFFLCLGVATSMVIMLSFRGAFGLQLAPFLAVIVGGGAGLYAALGWRRPSAALLSASFALPALTFFAITQFLLQRDQAPVLLTVAGGYGFATAAMLVPAVSEFDVAMGRTHGGAEGAA